MSSSPTTTPPRGTPSLTPRLMRRTLLRAAAATAAAWPLLIERAFACPPPLPECDALPPGVDDVQAAWRAAVESKRALLVLLVPDDHAGRWERGQLFGELLNHGTDEQLAPLGFTEIVCASAAALLTLVPNALAGKKLSENDIAIVVEPATLPPQARVVRATPPSYGELRRGPPSVDEERVGRERIRVVAAALREAIVTTQDRAQRLMSNEVAKLAAQVRAVAVVVPPRGTRWANSWGCGVAVEGEDPPGIRCGMGHVPKLSQRFLQFFTDG